MAQLGYWEMILLVMVPAAVLASWHDFRFRRIPNWLNAAIAVFGLGVQGIWNGWSGVQSGLLGMLVGFGILVVLWMMHVMGAGDVKFMAALGAWLGPELAFHSLLAGGIAGGVLALGMIAYKRSWQVSAANLGVMMSKAGSARAAFSDFGSARKLAQAGVALPYAIPLTIGTVIVAAYNYSGGWGVL